VRRILVGLLAALVQTGCFQVHYAYDGPKLLTTAPGVGTRARVVRHFEVHRRQFYWLFGLVPVGERVNGAEIAAAEAGGADGVVNLELADGQDLLDYAISNGLCLLQLLCGSWSVWVEGDVVELVGPPETAWLGPGGAPAVSAGPGEAE